MNIRIVALASAAALPVIAVSAELSMPTANDPLVGCWEGKDYQPTMLKTVTWLMNRKGDGTFEIRFSESGANAPYKTEEGTWSHKDGVYKTITLKVSGQFVNRNDPQYTDTYRVEFVESDVVAYRHEKLKLMFRSKKVPCACSAA
jgi:hypothetical protein